MALDKVEDFVTRARVLLQDEIDPYRYEDTELIQALNEACMEAKRLRPDLFLRTFNRTMPSYTDLNDPVSEDEIPYEYRVAFIYYIVGNAQLRDDEETTDAKASSLLNKFVAQLMNIPS